MFNFLKPKKKTQSFEINKKELEQGKYNFTIYFSVLFYHSRNIILTRIQRRYVYKSKRSRFRISY